MSGVFAAARQHASTPTRQHASTCISQLQVRTNQDLRADAEKSQNNHNTNNTRGKTRYFSSFSAQREEPGAQVEHLRSEGEEPDAQVEHLRSEGEESEISFKN